MTTTTKTNLDAVNPALPANVKLAITAVASYLDSATLIGPAASAVDLTRSRLAGVIDGLNRTLA